MRAQKKKQEKRKQRTAVIDHVYEVNSSPGVLREHRAESWVNKVFGKRLACVFKGAFLRARFPDLSRRVILISLHL